MIQTLLQDLHYGYRRFVRSPIFTLTVLLTLALSIGVNSAIFSLINAVLLRPLPYQAPERLVTVYAVSADAGRKKQPLYPPEVYAELAAQGQSFEQVAAYVAGGDIGFDLTGGAYPERVPGAVVSANFFATLGVQAASGRTFLPGEDAPGRDQVAVISDGLWRRRFNADPALIGASLWLNGRSYTLAGVMPEAFEFPSGAQLWVPDPQHADKAMNTALTVTHSLHVIARLKPEVTPQQAQTNLDALALGVQETEPGVQGRKGLRLSPLQEDLVGDIKPALLLLWGTVGFVLLIACANVANLLLARTAARRQEIAVRAALGATRARLIKQLLTESMLLAVVGGGAGLLLAYWTIDSLIALGPAELADLKHVQVDGRVLAVTLLGSLLTGLIFGLAPAFQAASADLHDALKEEGKSATGGPRRRAIFRALVVAEIALALLLLIGAGLMLKSFLRLTRIDFGFNTANTLTMKVSLPGWKYPGLEQQTAFYQQVLERLGREPGLEAAGWINLLPTRQNGFQVLFQPEGQPLSLSGPTTNCASVTADYFKAMGIPLVKGRAFTEQDLKDSPKVVIIDQTMARQFWPGEEAVGKRLNWQGSWREIVGLVGDVKPIGLGRQSSTQMYIPQPQFEFPWMDMYLVVRGGANDVMWLRAAAQEAIWEADRDQPIDNIKTLGQLVSDSLARQYFNMILLVAFAGLSLVLAAGGIYGLMAYSIAQRTQEIGIRIALGARQRDVLKLIMGQGLMLITAGVVAGLGLAIALTRLLFTFLYNVSVTDITIFAAGSLVLTVTALLACYFPARRAMKVNPMIALRNE